MTTSIDQARQGRERTAPPARPFFFPGNRIGVLLLHGFAGSIADLREFGRVASEQGYSVLGARLAGHGMSTRDLHETVAEDWLASARNALYRLREWCDVIVIVGESMGGLLGLRLAREERSIRGLILLAPPFRLKQERLRAIVSRLLPPTVAWRKSWVDERRARRGSLRRVTSAAYRELMRIVATERQLLTTVAVPVLAIFSSKDFVTGGSSQSVLQQPLPSELVRTVVIDEPIHHINEARDRERLFHLMTDFIAQVT